MKINRPSGLAALTGFLLAFSAFQSANAQSITGFTVLNTPNDAVNRHTNVIVKGVSGNGSVVVGQANAPNGVLAFRWTAAGGFVDLTTPAAKTSIANAVSYSGDICVGLFQTADLNDMQAVCWGLPGNALTLIPLLPFSDSPGINNAATAISADGKIVVGYCGHITPPFFTSSSFHDTGFAWTINKQNIQNSTLAQLSQKYQFDHPLGVANNGSTVLIVGGIERKPDAESFAPRGYDAQKWSLDDGASVDLISIAGVDAPYFGTAYAVSADLSTIVGENIAHYIGRPMSYSSPACVWYSNLSDQPARILSGYNLLSSEDSSALAVSQDGSVIVGAGGPNFAGAFLWSQDNPTLRDLRAELISKYGIVIDNNLSLDKATGVTKVGNEIVIVGNGHCGTDLANSVGWIARVTP